MPAPKKLFLLDAMALIYRAYYALNKNPRVTSKGVNTSAIMGFANTLYDVIKKEKPTHIGVAFDTMAPTVRHEEFSAYKANRQAMPEELSASIPHIMQLIRAFNIPILFVEGYEADDVIGTLARRAEEKGFETYMMTPDKDFGQLVTEKTLIYKPAKFGNDAEIMGIKEVCEKFGIIRTSQVKDMLGLWGDASDNIPGIPGIGEVIARKLLERFDSVENLIERASEIDNPKLREKVETHAAQALASKQLATIILDVPIPFDEDALILVDPDRKALKEILDELELRNFAKRVFTDLSLKDTVSVQPDLFGEIPHPDVTTLATIENAPHTYHLADSADLRFLLIEKLRSSGSFCFDTETTGIDANASELVGMSFAIEPGEAWFVPVPPQYSEAHAIVQEFKEVLESDSIEKIGQNLKFDISILKWYDVDVKGPLFDTMLAHYLLEPDQRHNMDFLAETHLGYKPVPIEDLIGKKGAGQGTMHNVPMNKLVEYAAEDADVTLQLKEVFAPLLVETDTRKLFDEIEVPLVRVLASMEAEGVKIDIPALKDYSVLLQKDVEIVEEEIYSLAGERFNISSPRQLGIILFEKLKVSENPRLTTTKQYATGEEVLEKLLHKHDIVAKILDYRSLTKLKSTYVDALPGLVSVRDGRIHTSYNQAVASTGRLSSNNPNLQNIPIRTERGREIRKAFVPRNEHYLLLAADYSQIELRIIAHLSRDTAMMEAFRNGYDIHTATASKVYDIPFDEVTREQRRNAKSVNFGIVYGISAFGLSENLGIPRKEAAEIINQYFRQYPGVKTFMDSSIAFARENQYVETIMKRRRYLRDINSANAMTRGFAERNAINAPIQGSAADMIKIAMIRIFEEFEKRKLRSRMILQVHDELVFDVLREEAETVQNIVSEQMKTAMPLDVPVEVDMNTGTNWLEAH
jgi:DNA polymerase-1